MKTRIKAYSTDYELWLTGLFNDANNKDQQAARFVLNMLTLVPYYTNPNAYTMECTRTKP